MCYTGHCYYDNYFGECMRHGKSCVHPDWWEPEEEIEDEDNEEMDKNGPDNG